MTGEASAHCFITINTLLSTVAGICVHYVMDDDMMTSHYAVNGGLIFWSCFVANFLNLIVRVSTASSCLPS